MIFFFRFRYKCMVVNRRLEPFLTSNLKGSGSLGKVAIVRRQYFIVKLLDEQITNLGIKSLMQFSLEI